MHKFPRLILLLYLTVVIVARLDDIEVSLGHLWYGKLKPPDAKYQVGIEARRGEVRQMWHTSQMLGVTKTYYLYTPPDFDDSKSYETIYFLHGFAGSAKDWLVNAKINLILDKLIQDGDLPPVVAIFPDGQGSKFVDSEYLDATTINQPMESYLVNELVPLIDESYSTGASRKTRAIIGLSAGGYGAVNMSLHHPELFGYAMSLSGYFAALDPAGKRLLGSDQQARDYNLPAIFLETHTQDIYPAIFISAGERDGKYLTESEDFANLAKDKGLDVEFYQNGSYHTWDNWRLSVVEALKWLGSKLPTSRL